MGVAKGKVKTMYAKSMDGMKSNSYALKVLQKIDMAKRTKRPRLMWEERYRNILQIKDSILLPTNFCCGAAANLLQKVRFNCLQSAT